MTRLPPILRAALSVVLSVALVFATPAFALGPLERNHPAVADGLEAYAEGRFDEALAAFDRADQELPGRAAVQFNRGNALFKLGRLEEAKRAYHQAAELDRDGSLRARDYYNLGNTWAAMGNDREAISAYRRALSLDPSDEDARHNLEVLLRKLPPRAHTPDGGTDGGQDGGSDGGAPDAGDAGMDGGLDGGMDGGADAGTDGGTDGGRPGDAGPRDGGSGDRGGDGGSGPAEERGDGGSGEGEPEQPDGGSGDPSDEKEVELEEGLLDGGTALGLSKQDAERILDAMKQSERNLQLWRFQQKEKQKRKEPRSDEKDW